MTKKRVPESPPVRPATHVSPVLGCRCGPCQQAVIALAIAREQRAAAREARLGKALGALGGITDYLEGKAAVEVGANATDELMTLLGARRRGTSTGGRET